MEFGRKDLLIRSNVDNFYLVIHNCQIFVGMGCVTVRFCSSQGLTKLTLYDPSKSWKDMMTISTAVHNKNADYHTKIFTDIKQ